MRCPFCHNEESKVTDSRIITEANSVKRRRQCLKCLRRFTTFETVELTLQVIKRDGYYQDFSLEKLIKGLDSACFHTKVSRAQVRTLAGQVMTELMERSHKEVTTKEIGEMVMKHLQVLDPVAYIRFACVYRRFKHVDELMDAIGSIPLNETVARS